MSELDGIYDDLKTAEGWRSQAYRDSRGFLTIGYGRLIDPKVDGSGISPEEGVYLLENDVHSKKSQLDREIVWWRNLSPIRQRVLLNMSFNMGVEKVLTFKNTLDAVKRGDFEAAAWGMRHSAWYKQVGARAERLAQMMEHNTEIPR